jgi:TetR/AcrR family transcriptional regulator, regulator of cefoperazone and chloramphenicol sensitivity
MSPRNIVSAGQRRGRSEPRNRRQDTAPDAQRGSGPRESAPRRRSAPRGRSTREHLLEIAGQVFSEKGFPGATGKEICERSGANAAAVVYHFGGMDSLYGAVLQEARNRLAPSEALAAAVAEETDPKAKLVAFIGLLVRVLSEPVSSTWAARLMSREIISPTAIFDEVRNKEMRARAEILKSIISELTGLPDSDPAVARSCVNIMAPFGVLLLINPRRVEKAFPALSFGPESTDDTTRHMVQFALGGLAAIARDARLTR